MALCLESPPFPGKKGELGEHQSERVEGSEPGVACVGRSSIFTRVRYARSDFKIVLFEFVSEVKR